MKIVDIVGKRYGRLIVQKYSHISKGHRYWKCVCDCGNTITTISTNLINGNTKSCGCLQKELARKKLTKYEDREYASFLHVYGAYQRSAKKREISFSLSVEEFIDLCKRDCVYCGRKPEERDYGYGRVPTKSSGIDRINNYIGYVLENCVPCCTWCNYSKRELSMGDFVENCTRVARRFS